MTHQLKHVTIGGTFDHLHIGHQSIIDKAFAVADKVSLALSTDEFASAKNLPWAIQSYQDRQKELRTYFKQKHYLTRAVIRPLERVEGFADTDTTLDGIIVTRDTRHNAALINRLRRRQHLPPLTIVTIPLLKAADKKIISSTKIRLGAIDRRGYLYRSLFLKRKSLPKALRAQLRQPIGAVIKNTSHNYASTARRVAKIIRAKQPPLVISVGDVITNSLLSINYHPQIMIVDHKTRRRRLTRHRTHEAQHYFNPAGSITKQVVKVFQKTLDKVIQTNRSYVMAIKGEEDLLALPAFALAPLGSIVLYGQYEIGVVVVEITEDLKARITRLLQQFL